MLSRGEKYFFRPAGSFCTRHAPFFFFIFPRYSAPEVFRQAFLQKGRPSPRRSARPFPLLPLRRPLSPAAVSCPSARGLLFPVSPSHRPRVFGTLLRIRMEAVRQVAFFVSRAAPVPAPRSPRHSPRRTISASARNPLAFFPQIRYNSTVILPPQLFFIGRGLFLCLKIF